MLYIISYWSSTRLHATDYSPLDLAAQTPARETSLWYVTTIYETATLIKFQLRSPSLRPAAQTAASVGGRWELCSGAGSYTDLFQSPAKGCLTLPNQEALAKNSSRQRGRGQLSLLF